MLQKRKILWVEDSARFELPSLIGPIYASRRYDLTLAENATAAAEHLRHSRFEAIIVDVRLPPGAHAYWRGIYENAGADRTNAKLGLALLAWLFGPPVTDRPGGNGANAPRLPEWKVRPQQVAVFSVETHSEIGPMLAGFGVEVMHEKRPGLPDTILLDIVSEVLTQSALGVVAAPGQ